MHGMLRTILRTAVPLLMAVALVALPASIQAADRLLAAMHMDSGQLPAAEEEVGHAGAVALPTSRAAVHPCERLVARLGRHDAGRLADGIRRIHVPPPEQG